MFTISTVLVDPETPKCDIPLCAKLDAPTTPPTLGTVVIVPTPPLKALPPLNAIPCPGYIGLLDQPPVPSANSTTSGGLGVSK